MIKILSIGNSFSQDSQHYLYLLARNSGVKVKAANLYIGGCSLYRHYRNMLTQSKAYSYELNGEPSGFMVSIDEALLSDEWDVITVQQASHYSTYPDTFTPFIEELTAHIRKMVPKAKILFHKTWAYENGCERLTGLMGFQTSEQMAEQIDKTVQCAVLPYVDGVLPIGDAMASAIQKGIKVHRDSFHASLGIGRLLQAATWLASLTGKAVSPDAAPTLDITGESTPIEEIIEIANEAAANHPLGFSF